MKNPQDNVGNYQPGLLFDRAHRAGRKKAAYTLRDKLAQEGFQGLSFRAQRGLEVQGLEQDFGYVA